MLSYAEVFDEGARSQLLPTSIIYPQGLRSHHSERKGREERRSRLQTRGQIRPRALLLADKAVLHGDGGRKKARHSHVEMWLGRGQLWEKPPRPDRSLSNTSLGSPMSSLWMKKRRRRNSSVSLWRRKHTTCSIPPPSHCLCVPSSKPAIMADLS